MNQLEKEIILFLERKKEITFFLSITLLGVLIRWNGRNYISGDMDIFLLPWYREIKGMGGLQALHNQIGDYGIPYQFLIALMTYIPVDAVYLYKIISCIFDFLLAFFSAQFVCLLKKEKSNYLFCLVYSMVLILPTVVLNSSVWGQCDSIYTTFVILALYFLYGKRYKLAFIFLGVAFSLKLQTIFVVPFFIYYYVQEKEFGIGSFFLSLLTNYIIYIPGFIMGRSWLEPIKIYLEQTNEYQEMWCNFPSIWALLGNHYEILKNFALIVTIYMLGMGLLYSIHANIKLTSSVFILVLIWSIWTCLLFLPSMHERYGYILDIFFICLIFIERKQYIRYAIITILCSMVTYGNYLFGLGIEIKFLAVVYTVAYINYTYKMVNQIKQKT